MTLIEFYKEYLKTDKEFNYFNFRRYLKEIHNFNLNIGSQSLYNILNNINEIPKCPMCGKELNFISLNAGYKKYCGPKCSNSDVNKIKKSIEWYKDKEKVQNRNKKSKETIKNKYGKEFYVQTEEFKNKSLKTIINRYGCFNGAQKNIIHFEDLNKDFILKNFYKNNKLLVHDIRNYFNLGYDGMRSWLVRLGLDNISIYKGNNISKGEKEWLDLVGLPDDRQHRQVNICNYIVDGYDPETNTIYEYLGDYWHGNPIKFNLDSINKLVKKTFLQLYMETKHKFDFLNEMGYIIFYTWENDFVGEHEIIWATQYNKDFDVILNKYQQKVK